MAGDTRRPTGARVDRSARPAGAPSARSLSRSSVPPVLIAILAAAVAIPLLLAIATGSIAIPHNDAWSHSKIAEGFAATGSFDLVGWNRTALAGQVVVLGPLGGSLVAQNLFVFALSLVALAATYAYVDARVGRGPAVLATAIVAANPEFGLLSTSYMSDMPAFAALMLCLVLTDRALKSAHVGFLAAALVVGVWGVTIREQDLVGPVVAVAVTVVAWRGRKRLAAIALGVLAAGAVVAFELWRRSLPFGDPPGFHPDLQATIDPTVQTVFTLALYVSPAVLFVARPGDWSRRVRLASLGVFALALWTAVRWDGEVFLGNYLARNGAYSAAAQGARSSVVPPWLWLALIVLACAALALAVGALLNARPRIDRVTLLVGLLLIVGTLGQAVVGQVIHGRGLLPLVPIVCMPLLLAGRRRQRGLALPSVGVLLVTTLALTANAMAFDSARWQAATALVESGVAASDIDAGLEWDGYHATGPAKRYSANPDALGWHIKMFAGSRQCYLVRAAPLDDREPVSTQAYPTYAVVGESTLWVYRHPDCARPGG